MRPLFECLVEAISDNDPKVIKSIEDSAELSALRDIVIDKADEKKLSELDKIWSKLGLAVDGCSWHLMKSGQSGYDDGYAYYKSDSTYHFVGIKSQLGKSRFRGIVSFTSKKWSRGFDKDALPDNLGIDPKELDRKYQKKVEKALEVLFTIEGKDSMSTLYRPK